MTLDLTFHMLAMNDNCIQNSWLLIAKDFLIIFSLFLIFSHFLSLFIIFYHFKTFFTTLVVIIYIFKILAKLILANLGAKIDVPKLVMESPFLQSGGHRFSRKILTINFFGVNLKTQQPKNGCFKPNLGKSIRNHGMQPI